MTRAVRCSRCGRPTKERGDRFALLLPGGPIAVVVICGACFSALTVWLNVAKG